MDRVMLLEELKAVTEEAIKDLIMPVRVQSAEERQQYRAAEVYLMRLPDGTSAKKKAPYIIHQAITSRDVQPAGERERGVAVVRSIFAVYSGDEQEGGLMLLNLMERLRIRLLRQVVIGRPLFCRRDDDHLACPRRGKRGSRMAVVKKETAESAAERAGEHAEEPKAPKKTKKPDGKAAGFCVYLGPSIRGVIQSGAVYRGGKADVLSELAPALERYPLIASLIVTGDTLPEDRIKVKTAGNLLNVNYKKLASGRK